jgi:5-methylthioribose kinase
LRFDDLADVERYLEQRGWLTAGERVQAIARAGEGNMNLALRVTTTSRSVIIKHGRPWVEKYPSIAAPADRTLIEAEWYAIAGRKPTVASRIPKLLDVDRDAKVLVLTDLGARGDYLHLYTGGRLTERELDSLVEWLVNLHIGFRGDRGAARLRNPEMRRLNHEHIFEVPFRDHNGLDLDAITPGLAAAASDLRTDERLLDAIRRLGERYLADGGTLLHGDYYPGSWLQAEEPWIIDPEFGFYGPPEFDVGVMLAHLRLATQPARLADRVLQNYRTRVPDLSTPLAEGFAGVEMLRRLLGVSQLPVGFDLAAKRDLIEHGRRLASAADA